ncbi:uncharacterized protein EAE97_001912 [Botrytis byssoidea]|uniref:2EXR domain-containing protein n=1 Tax=Botrytis byssoidea TaxID=139641 RepID=A0A9P5ISR9_9HELO|nr:uncharacterized protein EAE97_001912 [Botrytis byssoidea]KAF7952415.1 hypothetical protein EAE97_001912 [Botrytis byssoidea]
MASATTQQNTFHAFPRLPLELRLEIWRLSFPGPRLIRIFFIEGHFMSNATVPPGLHVCKESRNETLRFYKLCFAADPSNARIYFNVDCDVPHLIADHLDSYFYNIHNFSSPFPKFTHAAIRNDLKTVCLENCRHVALEYEGVPMHLFGPNCQVFDFHGFYFRTQIFYYGEPPQQILRQRIGEIFGTSKFTHVNSYAPTCPIGWALDPSPQPPDSFAPLIEQVWAADFHGFNDIVWQFIEQKVNTTCDEERKS